MAPHRPLASFVFSALIAVGACSSSCSKGATTSSGTGAGTSSSAAGSGTTASGPTTSGTTTSAGATGTGGASTGTGGSAGTGGSTGPSASDLSKLVQTCNQVSNGLYKAKNDSTSATIPICKLNGAFFWNADMDIDCDGQKSMQCSLMTDKSFQNQTSATDSQGMALDAATLPYVVIPLPDSKFDYMAQGIQLGDVVAVIYNGQIMYGAFGDEGPTDLIGEASYAMAASLGINPDPTNGGADCCGVTYIVFPGSGAVVNPIEDNAAAKALGKQLATKLLQNN